MKYILKPVVAESGPNKSFTRKREQKPDELGVVITRNEAGAPLVTVTDEAGTPVAGAEVELEIKLGKLVTDADGQVSFGVPAGTTEIKVKAEASGADEAEAEGEIYLVLGEGDDGDEEDDEDEGERLTIAVVGELTAGAPLTLLVTNAAGEPVVGADVGVKLEIAAGETGADGTLALVVPDDAIEIEAQARTDTARGDSGRGRRGPGDDSDGERGDRDDGQRSGDNDNSGRGNGDDRDGNTDDRGQSGSGRGGTLDEDDLRVEVDGQVTAGAEITIVVTDYTGEPVEGAVVVLNDTGTGITGADGTVVMLVPADAEQIEVHAKFGDADGEVHVAF